MTKKRIILIFIALCVFVILKLLLGEYKILISSIVNKKANNLLVKVIENFLCVICSLSLTNIISLLNIFFSQKNRVEIPSLNVYSCFVSNLRKNSNDNNKKKIIIGNGTSFIYIDTILENDGKINILPCKINGQNLLGKKLKPNERLEFKIFIYKKDNDIFKEEYELNILYTDNDNKKYTKKIIIKLDFENREANFENKKQKRRYYIW